MWAWKGHKNSKNNLRLFQEMTHLPFFRLVHPSHILVLNFHGDGAMLLTAFILWQVMIVKQFTFATWLDSDGVFRLLEQPKRNAVLMLFECLMMDLIRENRTNLNLPST